MRTPVIIARGFLLTCRFHGNNFPLSLGMIGEKGNIYRQHQITSTPN
jgi:hypothetical protein